ncbi:MAG: MFS transporter [Pseudomonadota bacterium]|nr:MFS transporter [Pseudomonadota bacterium]
MPIKRSSKTVVFVGMATAFSLLGDQALYSVLPVYFEELGLAPIEVGLILSVNRWIRLITNHFAYRMAERFRSDLLFVGALFLGSLTTAMYVFTSLFTVLLAARLIWGLAWSFIRHIGVLEVMREVPADVSGRTMGVYNGISRLGSVTGLFGGALLVDLVGFSAALFAIACASLLAIPMGLKARLPDRPLPSGQSTKGFMVTTDARIYAVIGFTLGAVGPGLVAATLGAVLADRLGVTVSAVSAATLTGAILAARYVLDSLAAPWLGGLSDRYGVRTSVVAFTSFGGMALLVAAGVDNVYLVAILTILFFGAGTALQAGVTGAVSQHGSGPFRNFNTSMDFGAASGPLVGWWLLDALGFDAAGIALGGGMYLMLALFVAVARSRL